MLSSIEESKVSVVAVVNPTPLQSSERTKREVAATAGRQAEFGFDRPKLRPTSPNTPHLTHIKQKNVVKKFAFATRVGFEPGNADKVNEDAFILAPNVQER